MVLKIDNLSLRYEPFPIGVARPIMDAQTYRGFLDTYPPIELFEFIPKVGNKYCLSEKFNPANYHEWIESHANWREFHREIKSKDFIYGVFDLLRQREIDLGFKRMSKAKRLHKTIKKLFMGRSSKGEGRLSCRFDFSMLPADGGYVSPHTDSTEKIVTIVISMVDEGEWDPALGGGTEVNRHLKPERSFSRLNGRAGFDEMETLDVFPFEPNQCVLFVKTFNSWHCVRPMEATGSKAMRRSLTLNIELRH
jgi:hypothetical protein